MNTIPPLSPTPSTVRTFLIYRLPVLAWMLFIFSMSTGSGSAEVTNPYIFDLLHSVFPSLATRLGDEAILQICFGVRKAAHITEYAILGILLYRAFIQNKTGFSIRIATLTLLTGMLYALTDEIHQSFVPGRWATPVDVCIDTVGVLLGVCIAARLFRSR